MVSLAGTSSKSIAQVENVFDAQLRHRPDHCSKQRGLALSIDSSVTLSLLVSTQWHMCNCFLYTESNCTCAIKHNTHTNTITISTSSTLSSTAYSLPLFRRHIHRNFSLLENKMRSFIILVALAYVAISGRGQRERK